MRSGGTVAPGRPARYSDGANLVIPVWKAVPVSVDKETVRRVARLARIAVSEDQLDSMQGELNAILGFVEQLGEVDVEGVEPMTSVTPMACLLYTSDAADE